MVKTSRLTFIEPKRLPSLDYFLLHEFGIVLITSQQCLLQKLNNNEVLLEELTYSLVDLVDDYYQLEFSDFKKKFEYRLRCKMNDAGYLVGINEILPIRDLAYFANKEKKYNREVE